MHSVADAKRASEGDAVDYLMFGTVFTSASKPGLEPAGLAVLADAARAATVPLLAVGGVTAENAALVARAGADGLAAIGSVLGPTGRLVRGHGASHDARV